ncbi:MAG: ATP-binding protein [Planctomycetota bacterium]
MPKRVFASQLENIPEVERAIVDDVTAGGFGDKQMFAIRLALAEVLANAVRHGNDQDPEKMVTAEWTVTAERFTLSVEDEGDGFNPDDVPDPTLEENLLRPCGRGVMLMQAYLTEIRYENGGRRVVLTKDADCQKPDAPAD